MKIIQSFICLLLKHNWVKTTFVKYELNCGWNYYKCRRCNKKKKVYHVEYL